MKTSLRQKINLLINRGISDTEIESLLESNYPKIVKKLPQIPLVNNRLDLVEKLRAFQPAPVIEIYRLKSLKGKSVKKLMLFTMDSSIYRAFHHETPSERFKKCSWHSELDHLLKNLQKISDQEAFDLLAYHMGETLVADWGKQNDLGAPSRMNIGVAMKITNLALKHLSFSGLCENPELVKYLHVPWDSFTLKPIRNIWKGNPSIPIGAGQGFVKDIAMYKGLHKLISDITQEAEVPRINYELWAWDASH
jgi:hypothetical protein